MDLGVVLMLGSAGLTPPELGRAVEERGFDSLFWAEHTHIPIDSTRTDGRPVRPYADTFDPFVALSAAAAVTAEIKLGTGVCLVTERDPIVLAKEVASLDRLSGGRFLFGVGAGWNRAEMANHGTDPRTRMALLADRIRADMAEFRRRVTALRQRAADTGRGRIPVTVFGVPPDKGLLAEFAAAGADRCLLALAHLDASQTLASLDDWAGLIPA